MLKKSCLIIFGLCLFGASNGLWGMEGKNEEIEKLEDLCKKLNGKMVLINLIYSKRCECSSEGEHRLLLQEQKKGIEKCKALLFLFKEESERLTRELGSDFDFNEECKQIKRSLQSHSRYCNSKLPSEEY